MSISVNRWKCMFCVLNYSKFTGTGYAGCSQPDYRCQPERYEKLGSSQQEMEQLNTHAAGSSHCPLSHGHAQDDSPLLSVTILAFHKTPGKERISGSAPWQHHVLTSRRPTTNDLPPVTVSGAWHSASCSDFAFL